MVLSKLTELYNKKRLHFTGCKLDFNRSVLGCSILLDIHANLELVNVTSFGNWVFADITKLSSG